jgi:hypothetical protein
VEKYLVSQQPKGNRRSVEIEVPPRADRRRKSPNWEDKAILNLAKAGLQNDCNREIFQRIARRARLLAQFVPEDRWHEVTPWLEEE